MRTEIGKNKPFPFFLFAKVYKGELRSIIKNENIMASESKKRKTSKKLHPGRDGKFLKLINKCKGLTFFNSSERSKLKKIDLKN